MFRATVNQSTFDILPAEEGFSIGGELFTWDLVQITGTYFHVLHKGKSYRAEIVKSDPASKTFQIKVNGTIHPVTVRDKFDLLLEKMGMNHVASGKVNNIKAPMPGLIIDLKVRDGDKVSPGDQLLILEAMKMENVIKATGEGIVRNVKVKKGDSVEKNQVLIEF